MLWGIPFPLGMFLVVLLSSTAWAERTPAGQFFLLERGVRQEGMAGAWAALSDDVGGAFSNPAGLAWLEQSAVFAGGFYRPLDDGKLAFGSLGFIRRTGLGTAYGIAASSFHNVVQDYDSLGNPVDLTFTFTRDTTPDMAGPLNGITRLRRAIRH